jgi:FkbM family methyltransferase
MQSFKIFIINSLIFLGQRTFFGRGKLRGLLIKIMKIIIFNNLIKNSIPRDFVTLVLGVPFIFIVDKLMCLKFYLRVSEKKEIFFIKKNTTDNTVFFDIGANIGIYTQMVASSFDKIKNSTIIAIEPDPSNVFRIKQNLSLLEKKIPNIFSLVKIEECGVGDSNQEMYLDKNYGFAQNRVIDFYKKNTIKIKVKTLLDIIEVYKISHITNLKIDIEGYEDKALLPFFKDAGKELYPKNIIIEHSFTGMSNVNYLNSIGYKIFYINKVNAILQLQQ